ncbi:reverse transcriptase domain-containing protein [Tanacetum coccineum]
MEPQEKVSLMEEVLVNPAYPDQLVTVGKNLSPKGSAQLKALLKKNKDIFAWEPSDMTCVPRRIIKHALNANLSITPVSQKRRVFSLEKSQVVTHEVVEWLKAGIVRPVRDKLENRVNHGIPFKCFLDAYKGYHQVKMAKEDVEKTAFYTDQERNYAQLEKLALALRHVSRRMRRYFEALPIKVIMDQPINQILSKAEASGKLAKYSVELRAYDITYEPHNAIKGQVLADFIKEVP